MSISNRSVVTRRGFFLGIASNIVLTRIVTKCFLAPEFEIYALPFNIQRHYTLIAF